MNRITIHVASCLFGVILLLFGGNVFAAHVGCPTPAAFPLNGCDLPSVGGGSYPYFDQGVKIKYKAKKHGDFDLKAKYDKASHRSQFLFTLGEIFDIDKTKFKFKAKVRNGVATGKLKIEGTLEGFGITKKETLVTANLEGTWELSADGHLFGFKTKDIVCNDALNFCTEAETIYLVLDHPITAGLKKLKTTGIAITTVPLPAAAWLFGSGLLCLAGMARKHRRTI